MPARYEEISKPLANELSAINHLKNNLPNDYVVLAGVNIPNRYKDRDTDVIVLTPHAIYSVELKNWYGNLTGNSGKWYWQNGSEHQSPLKQAQVNAQILKENLKKASPELDKLYVYPVVFLTSNQQVSWNGVHDDPLRLQRLCTRDTIISYLTNPQNLGDARPQNCTPYYPLIIALLREGFWIPERIHDYIVRGILWATGDHIVYEAAQEGKTEPGKLLRVTYIAANESYSTAMDSFKEHFQTEWDAVKRLQTTTNDPFGGKQYIAGADEPFPDEVLRAFIRPLNNKPGKPLIYAQKPIDRKEVYKLAEKLCRALTFLHQAGIFHRNIHPGNILWDAEHGIPTLLNLDWAGFADTDHKTKNLLNPVSRFQAEADIVQSRYYAPERQPGKKTDTAAVDLYAMGVVLWELLSNKAAKSNYPPFSKADMDTLNLPGDVANLINVYTHADPAHRASVSLEKAIEIFSDLQSSQNALPRLQPGFIFEGSYRIASQLKDTNNSVTYVAKSNIGEEVVIKLLRSPDDKSAIEELVRCMELMQALESKWTARYIKTGDILTFSGRVVGPKQAGARKVYYLVQSYIPGQTLRDYIRLGNLKDEQKISLAKGIAGALAAIHKVSYIHRDIKPENFIVTRDHDDAKNVSIRIIDFGLSRHVDEGVGTQGYSSGYVPPEVRLDLSRPWTPAGDVWSAARVICELFGTPLSIPVTSEDLPDASREKSTLDIFIEKNLSDDPANRCQDGTTFLIGLEQALNPVGFTENNQQKSIVEQPDQSIPGGIPVQPPTTQRPEDILQQPLEEKSTTAPEPAESQFGQWNTARSILDEIRQALKSSLPMPFSDFKTLLLEPYMQVEELLKDPSALQSEERADLSDQMGFLRRAMIAKVREGFEAALSAVEASRQRSLSESYEREASAWLQAFNHFDLQVVSDIERLIQAKVRFTAWENGHQIYNEIHKQLSAPGALEKQSENLRPKGEEAKAALQEIVKDFTVQLSTQGQDFRQADMKRLIELLEKELEPYLLRTSARISIFVSGNYEETYELFHKEKLLGIKTETYFISDTHPTEVEKEDGEPQEEISIDEALRRCKARWISFGQQKIKEYITKVSNRGFVETGPFREDPQKLKDWFESETARISLSWEELGSSVYHDYRSCVDTFDRAIATANGFKSRLKNFDINQTDLFLALSQLEAIGQEILSAAPFLSGEYVTRHDLLQNQAIAWLDLQISRTKGEFNQNPAMASKNAAQIANRIRSLPQFKAWTDSLELLYSYGTTLSVQLPIIEQDIKLHNYNEARKNIKTLTDTLANNKLPIPEQLSNCRREIDLIEKPQASTDQVLKRAGTVEAAALQAYQIGQFTVELHKSVNEVLAQSSSLSKQLLGLHQANSELKGIKELADKLSEKNAHLTCHQEFIALNLELSRSTSANLVKADTWYKSLAGKLDMVHSVGIPVDHLNRLALSLESFTGSEKKVSQWIFAAKDTSSRSLEELLDFYAQAEEISKLPTSQAALRSTTFNTLEQALELRAAEFVHQFSAAPAIDRVTLAEKVLQWYATHASTLKITLEGAIDEAYAWSHLRNSPADLNEALKHWRRAAAAKRTNADKHELALIKLLGIKNALDGVDRMYLQYALSHPILKHDRELRLLDFRLRLDDLCNEFELAGGKPEQSIQQKLTILEGEIGKAAGFTTSEENQVILAEENPLGNFWQSQGYANRLGKLHKQLPVSQMLLFQELRFKHSTYRVLASWLEKLNQDSTLKELDNAMRGSRQYIDHKMWREQRWDQLLRKQSELNGLYKKLWNTQLQQLLGRLGAREEKYVQHNGLRRWIISDIVSPTADDMVNAHTCLSQAYQSITSRCNLLESAAYLQALGIDEHRAAQHAQEYVAMRGFTADIASTMPAYVNAFCSAEWLDRLQTAFPGATTIQNPLQARIQEFYELNSDQRRHLFAQEIKEVMDLHAQVSKNATRLLIIDDYTRLDLDEYLNQYNRIGNAQPGTLANYPLYSSIEEKLTSIRTKRNLIISLLQAIQLASMLDETPCERQAIRDDDLQMMQRHPNFVKGMAPINWAFDMKTSLDELDPNNVSTWKGAVQYREHKGEKAICFIEEEEQRINMLRSTLTQLNSLMPDQPVLFEAAMEGVLNQRGFGSSLNKAEYDKALAIWAEWFGLEPLDDSKTIGEWCESFQAWAQQLIVWDTVEDLLRTQVEQRTINLSDVTVMRSLQANRSTILGICMAFFQLSEHATDDANRASCTRRQLIENVCNFQSKIVSLLQKSLCQLQVMQARWRAWQVADRNFEEARIAWLTLAQKKLQWLYRGKLEEAKTTRDGTVCHCCSIAPEYDQYRIFCRLNCVTDPNRTRNCGKFIIFVDPNC